MTIASPQPGRIARRSVLMLCAHEPTIDPRIRWEAEGGAKRFEVAVLGFNRGDGSLSALEKSNGYTIHRLRCREASILNYAWRLIQGTGGVEGLALLLIGTVALLPIAVAELMFRGSRVLYRSLKNVLPSGTGVVAAMRSLVLRAMVSSRLGYVLAVLRVQFAPATALFWKFVLDMPRKPDVIHCNDLDTLLVGVLARKRLGCRLVYDAHEYYPHSDPEGGWLDRTVFHFLEKLLAARADAVVTVNHQLAGVMQDAYGLRQVLSVPNAEPWMETPGPIPSAMTSLAAGRVKFLFQGRFSPERGLEEVLAAWPRIDPSRAALFLRGPDNPWRRELITRAEQLGILGRSVYFMDPVSEDQLVSAAKEADVGIISYKGDVAGYKYACPNKLSQYLHAGLMILTNNLPYVREVVEDAGAGLHYSSDDPESFISAVNKVSGDPEFLRCARDNALRYAREKFNWQAFSETLYALYAEGGIRTPMPAASLNRS